MQYLARQGISFRGDGDEVDSNLMQFLTLHAKEDAELQAWMERKNDRYLSHDMQNELLKVMALTILAKIGQAIKNSKFFSIMCDKCMDASNREQLAICMLNKNTLGVKKVRGQSEASHNGYISNQKL